MTARRARPECVFHTRVPVNRRGGTPCPPRVRFPYVRGGGPRRRARHAVPLRAPLTECPSCSILYMVTACAESASSHDQTDTASRDPEGPMRHRSNQATPVSRALLPSAARRWLDRALPPGSISLRASASSNREASRSAACGSRRQLWTRSKGTMGHAPAFGGESPPSSLRTPDRFSSTCQVLRSLDRERSW